MYCDNPRSKSIDASNKIGCCWSFFDGSNRWGNYPSAEEVFAGDYKNLPVKKEETLFNSLSPIIRRN